MCVLSPSDWWCCLATLEAVCLHRSVSEVINSLLLCEFCAWPRGHVFSFRATALFIFPPLGGGSLGFKREPPLCQTIRVRQADGVCAAARPTQSHCSLQHVRGSPARPIRYQTSPALLSPIQPRQSLIRSAQLRPTKTSLGACFAQTWPQRCHFSGSWDPPSSAARHRPHIGDSLSPIHSVAVHFLSAPLSPDAGKGQVVNLRQQRRSRGTVETT